MHKCRIRLLNNRASISLELCNMSVFRGFHILCSFLGCTTPFIYLCVCFRVPFSVVSTFCAHSLVAQPHLSICVCVSVCHSLLLVYLFHLRICESFSTLLTLANILHQIFVPLSSPSSTIKTDKNWYQLCYFLVTHWVIIDPFSTSVKVHLV